jgi:anti-sigma28 factor (negative regulator of flagellin synthesis)
MPSKPPDENEPLDRDPIREARLVALRKSIANGTYTIPAGDIADKIIEDISRKR